jgi:hypothetical protein
LTLSGADTVYYVVTAINGNAESLSNTFHALQNERGFAMLYLRENTTQYKQEMLGYFSKSDLNIKQLVFLQSKVKLHKPNQF